MRSLHLRTGLGCVWDRAQLFGPDHWRKAPSKCVDRRSGTNLLHLESHSWIRVCRSLLWLFNHRRLLDTGR